MKIFSLFPLLIAGWNVPPSWIERKNEFLRRVNGDDPMGWWMKPASFPLQEDKHAKLKQDAERKFDLYGAIDVIKETELIKELDDSYPIGPIVDIIDDAVVFPREEPESSAAITVKNGLPSMVLVLFYVFN